MTGDRPLYTGIGALTELVRSNELVAIVEKIVGPLA